VGVEHIKTHTRGFLTAHGSEPEISWP